MNKEIAQQQFLLLVLRGMLLLFPFFLSGQNFPVQANPQVIPPYSLKLSEYGTGLSEKLILNLLLTDVAEFNLQVRLKLYIENNAGIRVQSSETVIGASPIFLDGGTPLRLTNIDLKPYFSLRNLKGITPLQYNKPFPEGLYRFCFEVYEAFSDRIISRKSCAVAYLVLNDPPFLNLPNRGEQITVKEPQNIIFQWTPRHLNATNVEYEFTLAEIWDRQMNPQAAFLASRPLYQTKTFANTLLYGPAEPAMLPDKRYGWRVRATVSDGISETSVFKNDGYSEIYHFTYADTCKEPGYVLAEAKSAVSEKIFWQGANHIRYNVQYRNKAAENSVWFDTGTVNEFTSIYNLEPGTAYEFRVGGQCLENGPFTYSQIYEFTTSIPGDDTATYNCGITPQIIITNRKPLEALVINDVFTAGDFPVTVKKVVFGNAGSAPSRGGTSSGYFTGWGFIVVPYLENTKIKVSFDGVRINSYYQLTEGIVFTDYDQNWGGVDDIGNEIDALMSLEGTIIEALNLDISKDTKERIKKITKAITDNIKDEELPDEIKKELLAAVENLETTKETFDAAQEELANATTAEEEKNAQDNINEAGSEFKDAQETIENAQDTVDSYTDDVADLIKKAIKELYREGKKNEEELLVEYQDDYDNIITETFDNENIIFIDDVSVEITYGASSEIQRFYDSEISLAITLFSKVLGEDQENDKTLIRLIEKSKEVGIDLVKEVKEMQDEEERKIIDHIKSKLIESYTEILLNYKI